MISAAPAQRTPYYPALEGVRCLSIALVLYDHLKSNGHTLPWLNGHLGVDLFFLISGFLITTLLQREQTLTGRIDLRAFFWRRFFRLAPLYFTVLGLYLAICRLPSQHLRWVELKAGLPWFITMLNEYAREPNAGTVFTHTWSLGVEEKFYLVWPLLFFVLARTRRARALTLCALFLCVGLAPLFGATYLARAYFGLLIGCGMALVLASPLAPRISAALAKLPAALILAVFLLGLVADRLIPYPLLAVTSFNAAFVCFLSYLIVAPSWLAGILAWAPLSWLGRLSYAMYLVHVLCLNAVESRISIHSGTQAVLVLTLAFALTTGVAAALSYTVEQPARNFGRRWLATRSPRTRQVSLDHAAERDAT